IDLKNADPERVESQIEKVFDIPREECIRVKDGVHGNCFHIRLLHMPLKCRFLCIRFQPNWEQTLKQFFKRLGVVANIAVFGGRVKKGDKIVSAYLCKTYEVNELGLLRPEEHPTQKLPGGVYSCRDEGCKRGPDW
ncbi:hypothetical protein XENOCAPTIV_018591, partial [Xenoophorus captivus]